MKELLNRAISIEYQLTRIADTLECRKRGPYIIGGAFVILIPDNQPDGTYTIDPVEGFDEEGSPVDAKEIAYEVTSTDDTVFALTPDTANPLAGAYHVGAPGVASVNVQATRASDALLLGSFGSQFTVTSGPVTNVKGGNISFSGLADTPAPPPAPVPSPPGP